MYCEKTIITIVIEGWGIVWIKSMRKVKKSVRVSWGRKRDRVFRYEGDFFVLRTSQKLGLAKLSNKI